MSHRTAFLMSTALFMLTLGCGMTAFVTNPAPLTGVSYWAAETATPVPTETRFLGMTTPVFADTPVPPHITTTPFWTTVTATPYLPPVTATPFNFTATPFWVTTTPSFITETPQPPVTTTPSLPQYGFTTPVPIQTPYYRIGRFYMHSDVYIGRPNGIVLRLTDHSIQPSDHSAEATYQYITVRLTNYGDEAVVVPVSDLFFIRSAGDRTGRWQPQHEPLSARGLPSYETQLLTPIAPDAVREVVLGFVVPNGTVSEVGLITNWQRPQAGGVPIWFLLRNDPAGTFRSAHKPPPPTSTILDSGGAFADGGGTSGGAGWGGGRWPTTGSISRGYGCHEFFTGVDGSGFGCPADTPWFHNGVDIANVSGTAIWSPVDGTLLFAGSNPTGADCSHMAGSQPPHQGFGNYQKIQGADTLHYFGHLSAFLVTSGDLVAGQHSAEMGSTGCSTGSHLHWTLYHNGSLADPELWAGGEPEEG